MHASGVNPFPESLASYRVRATDESLNVGRGSRALKYPLS